MCDEWGLDFWIEVDGGFKFNNIWQVLEVGVNVIVVGFVVFNVFNYVEAIVGVCNSKCLEF